MRINLVTLALIVGVTIIAIPLIVGELSPSLVAGVVVLTIIFLALMFTSTFRTFNSAIKHLEDKY